MNTQNYCQLPHAVFALAKFAAKDDMRPILNAVHVRPETNDVIAVDGFRMARIPLNDFRDDRTLTNNLAIPLDVINRMGRVTTKSCVTWVHQDDGWWVLSNSIGVNMNFLPLTGKLPDVGKIEPDPAKAKASVSLNAKFLKECYDLSQATGDSTLRATIHVYSTTGPVLITVGTEESGSVDGGSMTIMPMVIHK
jgi:hypothetical protein